VPANKEPIITTWAAAGQSLGEVAGVLDAAVRDHGTPAGLVTLLTCMMALSWGTPTPATTRVVQMEPGPTPTFTASTPASISALAPSAVAMLPATSWHIGEGGLELAHRIQHALGMAMGRIQTHYIGTGLDQKPWPSSPASAHPDGRAHPQAAHGRPWPKGGICRTFSMSLMVMRPLSLPASVHHQELLDAVLVQHGLAFLQGDALRTVTSLSLVITSVTGWSRLVSNAGRGW
jgi:hypothetical protein